MRRAASYSTLLTGRLSEVDDGRSMTGRRAPARVYKLRLRERLIMQSQQVGARFEARVSKKRMWVIILLALGFAAAGLWLVSAAEELAQSVRFVFFRDPFILRVFGWVAMLIGIVGAVIAFRQLFRIGPVIEIDAAGIRWRRWSDAVIPWSAITDASSRSMSNEQFLCLTLAQPAHHPGRSTARLLAGLNKNMGFGDIAISANGTDRSHDDLLGAVSHFRPITRP